MYGTMAVTNVELYEALRERVGEDAARMIAEVVPPAAEMATKHDIARLSDQIKDSQVSTLRWMVGLFIPVWAGTWATVVAVIIKL
jgi:hypothetical protein